jgi:hypothetical protein
MIAFTTLTLLALCLAALYLSIYIIPFLIGLQVFKWVLPTDDTGIDSIFYGVVAGVAAYFLLRFLFNRIRSRNMLRAFVAIIVLPVVWAGYTGALDTLHTLPSPLFRQALSLLIGAACGCLAFVRLNAMYRPRQLRDRQRPRGEAEVFEAEIVDPTPANKGPAGLAHAKFLTGPGAINSKFEQP